MFEFIKKMFVISLTSTVSASNHMKCVSSSNQTCMTHPTLINLHPNEYCQELRYYPFAINLDDQISRVCVPNEKEDLNLHFLI